MSVVFLVTPVLVAGWPVICAAAAAGAASLGFKLVQGARADEGKRETVAASAAVEMEMSGSEVLAEKVRPDEEMTFARGDLKVRLHKDARGRFAIHVSGRDQSDEELRAEGKELLNRIRQQYAYQKVTRELKGRGFTIVQEQATAEGRIQVRFRKFE